MLVKQDTRMSIRVFVLLKITDSVLLSMARFDIPILTQTI